MPDVVGMDLQATLDRPAGYLATDARSSRRTAAEDAIDLLTGRFWDECRWIADAEHRSFDELPTEARLLIGVAAAVVGAHLTGAEHLAVLEQYARAGGEGLHPERLDWGDTWRLFVRAVQRHGAGDAGVPDFQNLPFGRQVAGVLVGWRVIQGFDDRDFAAIGAALATA